MSDRFDLDTYISNYSGHARLKRLALIASRDAGLKAEALRMGLDEVQHTTNTAMYNELMALAEGGAFKRDDAWVEAVDRKAGQTLDKLEADLCTHKTSLVKESIRMGHSDLGDFFCARGDFGSALKCYVRTRDYCTTSKHVLGMCIHVIKVSIHMGNFNHVTNYVAKAESTPDVCDPIVTSQLRVAAGIALLSAKKYKLAARKFLEASAEMGSSFGDIISSQDVAVYGTLCALSSFERSELKSKLIDNTSFRPFLELVPDVRELAHDFYNSRYASCLAYLERLRPDFNLDLRLYEHVGSLYADIRSKAIIQYASPFVSVDLNRMATAFNAPLLELEDEVATLIMTERIHARIDSHNKVLYARHADKRNTTFEQALVMGNSYARDTKALVLRLNLMRNDFIVKASNVEGYTHGPSKSCRQDRAEHRNNPGSGFSTGFADGM